MQQVKMPRHGDGKPVAAGVQGDEAVRNDLW
jgi:hypothetical protein